MLDHSLLRHPLSAAGNHTGYGQWRGTKTTGEEILDLYSGLENAGLNNDFHMLLSGYLPGAEAVEAVGHIARDLRRKKCERPGGFFWGGLHVQVDGYISIRTGLIIGVTDSA